MKTWAKPRTAILWLVAVFLAAPWLINGSEGVAESLFIHLNVKDSDPYIPRLTRSEAQDHLEVNLFGQTGRCAFSYYRDDFFNFYYRVGFITDWQWNRIVYADWEANWVKAYGVTASDPRHYLYNPLGICATNGTAGTYTAWVFVAERGMAGVGKSRIARLRYDHYQHQLFFDDSLNVDADERHCFDDLCLHDNHTLDTVGDDYLWAVDRLNRKLLQYGGFGARGARRVVTLEGGTGEGAVGTCGDIVCGRNPSGENNDQLYMIDGAKSRLVRFLDNGASLVYQGSYVFPRTGGLTAVESDVYGNLYVLDMFANCIYKLSPDLEFVAKFSPGTSSPGGLAYPKDICNPRGTEGMVGWADLFVLEEWSDTTGGQWFQIGVKILDHVDSIISSDRYSITIPYRASDAHLLTVIVDRMYHGQYWRIEDTLYLESPRYGGLTEIHYTVPEPGWTDRYRFRTTGVSVYRRLSGDPVDQFYFVKDAYFGNKNPVVTDPLHIDGQSSDSCVLYWNPPAYPTHFRFAAYDPDNPPNGNNVDYVWRCTYGHFISPDGPRETSDYNLTGDYYPPASGASSDIISVEIHDGEGGLTITKDTIYLRTNCDPPPPDPECPTVYVLTKSGVEADNNLLAASEDTAQGPGLFTDHYLLRLDPLVDDSGYVHLELREDEHQTTTLDQVQLSIAWVDKGREVGLSDEGQVFYPVPIAVPVSAVDATGADRLAQLAAKDGSDFSGYGPGELTVNFGKVAQSGLGASPLVDDPGGPPIPPPLKQPDKISPYADFITGNILRVQVKDESGVWVKAGIATPRKYAGTMQYLDLSRWVKPDADLWVKLHWDQSYRLDHLAYCRFETEGIIEQNVPLFSAKHSSSGDVVKSLASSDDGGTVTLSPGEAIAFSFGPLPTAPVGKIATYVLTSVGRYTSETAPSPAAQVPTENNLLAQNSPNPFNEGTTLYYSLAQDGPVELEIFDILGRRVRTLVDEFQPAGRHEARWDARDSQGRVVASGIYFYRITTAAFSQSKKMTVVR